MTTPTPRERAEKVVNDHWPNATGGGQMVNAIAAAIEEAGRRAAWDAWHIAQYTGDAGVMIEEYGPDPTAASRAAGGGG